MKIEAKHLVLGEKIAKITIFTSIILWLLQAMLNIVNTVLIIAGIFGIITIIAYALIMFIEKGESILKLIVIFGGILFIFFMALFYIIFAANLNSFFPGLGSYNASITMIVLSFLLLAGLIFELITKKSLDQYQKYITGFMVFIFGLFFGMILGNIAYNGILAIFAEILVALGFVLLAAVTYFKLKGTPSSEPAE